MVKKKRKKKNKRLKELYKEVGDPKIRLRQLSKESGFTTGDDKFPIKTVFWVLIIASLILGLYFSKPVYVNECATGFSGLKPCHCYTSHEILNDPNVPADCSAGN